MVGLTAWRFGGDGPALARRSAEPAEDVEARLPCLLMSSNAEQIRDAVVETLNVLCESPPVPTISHCRASQRRIKEISNLKIIE